MRLGPEDAPRGICVMGRTAFGTGIGHLSQSLLELLGRRYDVALWDLHARHPLGATITTPTGRVVRLADHLEGFAVYFYADVLWNGSTYTEYTPPPTDGYRIAYLAFDSDELPGEWVEILNRDFDAVYFTSAHLVEIAVASGVRIEIGALPLALDIAHLVNRKYRPVLGGRLRFGTISAYHRRKGLEELVAAFTTEFADDPGVELVIHSNLAVGDTADAVAAMVKGSGATNITISTEHLSEDDKNRLLDTFDVYVNTAVGEGFSVGPREALAMGKVAVLSDIGAHRPLFEAPGVFPIEMAHRIPAIYPEIDGRQFGWQRALAPESLRSALRTAAALARSSEAGETARRRVALGARYSLEALERTYWAVVDPDSRALEPGRTVSPYAEIPDGHEAGVRRHSGRHGRHLGARHLYVPARDAGFFSLFNVYLSFLAWSRHDSPQRLVLPSWDAGRLLEDIAPDAPVSYCYSRPDQGNLWNHLFEPPYDLTPDELDDLEFVVGRGELATPLFNETREPLLTYIHAYQLYHHPHFPRIRRQYAAAIRDHVRLLPPYRQHIDEFLATNRHGRFLVAAHVKHPSHAIEQPGGAMASRERYVDLVRGVLREKGIRESSDDWAVFVATEQERVTTLFAQEFGDHVIAFDDVARIPAERDQAFDELPEHERTAEGHQLQHIMAADAEKWSPRLAWEVIRDAYVMASADVLFHEVSNVSTGVAFLSPDVDMRFVDQT